MTRYKKVWPDGTVAKIQKQSADDIQINYVSHPGTPHHTIKIIRQMYVCSLVSSGFQWHTHTGFDDVEEAQAYVDSIALCHGYTSEDVEWQKLKWWQR